VLIYFYVVLRVENLPISTEAESATTTVSPAVQDRGGHDV
jgi:hypothetical protein